MTIQNMAKKAVVWVQTMSYLLIIASIYCITSMLVMAVNIRVFYISLFFSICSAIVGLMIGAKWNVFWESDINTSCCIKHEKLFGEDTNEMMLIETLENNVKEEHDKNEKENVNFY
ncbi:hypothetical protein MHBO_004562 [Bonamia ostreae]|uniref:Uncharacterized protein n=1 Tax=Bonamia ostreae TaxID=126728 RepID=A0ABV2ATN1_9EUKA